MSTHLHMDGAKRSERLAEDQRARATAQRVFDRPLVLEAGAGTGKTATLVARFATWAIGPGWERAREALSQRKGTPPTEQAIAARVLGRMVLITFTDAAAAEMGERAAKALAGLAQGQTPVGLDLDAFGPLPAAERSRRAEVLAQQLGHASIGTIHAWCLRILARAPLEAGLHPRPRVDAEQEQLTAIARETVEDLLHVYWGDAEPARTEVDPRLEDRRRAAVELARRELGPLEVAEALAALLYAGAQPEDFDADPHSLERVHQLAERVREALRPLVKRFASRLKELKPAALSVALATAAQEALEGLESRPLSLSRMLAAVQPLLDPRFVEKAKAWSKGRWGAAELRALGEESWVEVSQGAGRLLPLLSHLQRLDPDLLHAARMVLVPLLQSARLRARRRGILAFGDLLRDAAALVRRDPEVRAQLRGSMDQLFVDEFQDTDPVQCDLVRAVALEGPLSQRPGLFVVGDPKQSIYGWRQADLAAYETFCRWVEQEHGEVLPLLVNRRSSAAILDEVAAALGPVMHHQPGISPAFQVLLRPPDNVPPEPQTPPGAVPCEYWNPRPSKSGEGAGPNPTESRPPKALVRRAEARAIAADICERVAQSDGALNFGDFAVLVRSTTHLDVYLEAMKAAAVPYAVATSGGYYRRREVLDAVALVRAVLDPNDHLALAAWLRSSAVGVPDAALFALWQSGYPEALWSDGPATDRLVAVQAALSRARARLSHLDGESIGLPRWHEVCWDATRAILDLRRDLVRLPADEFVEKLRTRTLLEVSECCRHLGAYRAANLGRFFRELVRTLDAAGGDSRAVLRHLQSGVDGRREEREGQPLDDRGSAVSVLTIHRAKGLEFSCVYVPGLDGVPNPGRGRRQPVDFVRRPLEVSYRLFGAATLDFDQVETRRAEVEHAEGLRLLYVALTRAKARLVLSGACADVSGDRHLAAWLAPRVGQLRDAHARGEVGSTALREVGGEGAPRAIVAPKEEVEPYVLDLDVVRLGARRLTARTRAERPRTRAISAAAHRMEAEPLGPEPFQHADAESNEFVSHKAPASGRRAAQRVGDALHRILEQVDLQAVPVDMPRRIAAARDELRRLLAADNLAGELPRALERLERLAQNLLDGPLAEHITSIGPHVLARELPILLAPSGDGKGEPLDAWVGAVDLVYRDPGTRELVVVDHKSDHFQTAEGRAERIRAYGLQVGRYRAALARALGPAERVRAELWLLSTGEVVRLFDPA